MKALCVRQPWATLIATGAKTLEVRNRVTRYRGPLLICTSAAREISRDGWDAIRAFGLDTSKFRYGIALAVVRLINSRPMTLNDEQRACCPHSPGMFVWALADARPVRSVRVRGQLGIFNLNIEPQLEPAVDLVMPQNGPTMER